MAVVAKAQNGARTEGGRGRLRAAESSDALAPPARRPHRDNCKHCSSPRATYAWAEELPSHRLSPSLPVTLSVGQELLVPRQKALSRRLFVIMPKITSLLEPVFDP